MSFNLKIKIYGYQYIQSVLSWTAYSIIMNVLNKLLLLIIIIMINLERAWWKSSVCLSLVTLVS